MKQIEIDIDSMDDEGRGRGIYLHTDGQYYDVAVRGAVVADRVIAEIERVFLARKLLVAKVVNFIFRSALHTSRKCNSKGPCPTCPLHAIEPSLSLDLKKARIERGLADVSLEFGVEDVLPHPQQFGYRQRIKLMARMVDKKLRFGVYIPYTHHFEIAFFLSHKIKLYLTIV